MWRNIMCDFSGSLEAVRIFYIELNGNFIFALWIFILWRVVTEQIMFINQGMGVNATVNNAGWLGIL